MVSSPKPPTKVSANCVPVRVWEDAGEPSVGKLGLKLSAVKALAFVFWRMARTVEVPDVPGVPSGSKERSVSLPFCSSVRKPEENGLEPS